MAISMLATAQAATQASGVGAPVGCNARYCAAATGGLSTDADAAGGTYGAQRSERRLHSA